MDINIINELPTSNIIPGHIPMDNPIHGDDIEKEEEEERKAEEGYILNISDICEL